MEQEENPIVASFLSLLSQLYTKICNCRRDYKELADLLDPKFHLEDCPYRQQLEKHDIKF